MTLLALDVATWGVEQYCFSVIPLIAYLFKTVVSRTIDIERVLRTHKIIPDIVDEAPKFIMDISYRNNVFLEMGNKIDPANMQWVPRVRWPARQGALYTLLMVDPDVPVRKNPTMAQRQHWVVGNIPESNYRRGETITGYIGPLSPRNSGLHRTTFLVYSQNRIINFTEPRYSSRDRRMRSKLRINIKQFVKKYFLKVHAVNFARTGWPIFEAPKGEQLTGPLKDFKTYDDFNFDDDRV